MANRDTQICRAFSLCELKLIEDALAQFEPKYELGEDGEELLKRLKSDVTGARRWAHQFGKCQR